MWYHQKTVAVFCWHLLVCVVADKWKALAVPERRGPVTMGDNQGKKYRVTPSWMNMVYEGKIKFADALMVTLTSLKYKIWVQFYQLLPQLLLMSKRMNFFQLLKGGHARKHLGSTVPRWQNSESYFQIIYTNENILIYISAIFCQQIPLKLRHRYKHLRSFSHEDTLYWSIAAIWCQT